MNAKPQRGAFITLEGGEGAGKSTQLAFIQQALQAAGKSVHVTREPGGTALGEQIRGVLLDNRNGAMHVDTELLLMFAARAQHVAEVIRPKLAEGIWVLCDRFTDATYAYQGYGRGISAERIAVLEQWVQGDLRPDATILLDIPVEQGMTRIGERSTPDRFEQERNDFFQRVRQGYLTLAGQYPERYYVINAGGTVGEVQHELSAVLPRMMVACESRGGDI